LEYSVGLVESSTFAIAGYDYHLATLEIVNILLLVIASYIGLAMRILISRHNINK
jgi:hypothetical protein